MPVGNFKTFAECISAMKKKYGKGASAVCGKIEADTIKGKKAKDPVPRKRSKK